MIVKAVKLGTRALIRVLALISAYSFVMFPVMGIIEAVKATWQYGVVFALVGLVMDLLLKVGRSSWRFTSLHDVLSIVRSSTIAAGLLLASLFIIDRAAALPRSALLLTWIVDISLFTGMLLLRRAIHERALGPAFAPFLQRQEAESEPLLLVGDLNMADAFLRNLSRQTGGNYRPIAVITNNVRQRGQEVRGIPVIATVQEGTKALDAFVEQPGNRAILFLDNLIAPADFDAELLGRLRTSGVRLLRLSGIVDLNEARAELREINLEELLARSPVKLDFDEVRALVSGRRVFVSGAGGSIGSELCRQITALGCAHISLLDNSEFALFNIDMEIGDCHPTLSRSAILCDIRTADRLDAWVAAEKPDVIFHAAALKHVPLMESHPCESVLTNVGGTWNLAEAARVNGVSHMIFISTDKAVDPANVMGATKRLAESVVRCHRAAGSNTRFSVVRFGNVLGSAGSVVPTFKAQIERGGPVTLTHPDIERYFMTIPEAVQLVLHATAKSAVRNHQSGVFVLDMGKPVKIMDLARRMIELSGKMPGRDIEIQITGLRPGEKLTEELVDTNEVAIDCDPGVVEVVDKGDSIYLDRHLVRKLEDVARTGDSLATRALVFDLLSKVRGNATLAKPLKMHPAS